MTPVKGREEPMLHFRPRKKSQIQHIIIKGQNSIKKQPQAVQPARTTSHFSNKPINLKRVNSQSTTIENVVRVRLQNRVSHAGLLGAAHSTAQLASNFIVEHLPTQEEVTKNKEDLTGDQFKNRKAKLYSEINKRESAKQGQRSHKTPHNKLPNLKAVTSKAGRFDFM